MTKSCEKCGEPSSWRWSPLLPRATVKWPPRYRRVHLCPTHGFEAGGLLRKFVSGERQPEYGQHDQRQGQIFTRDAEEPQG